MFLNIARSKTALRNAVRQRYPIKIIATSCFSCDVGAHFLPNHDKNGGTILCSVIHQTLNKIV